MVGLIILSLIISAFAFKEKPPLSRATHTVLAAALAQISLSLLFNILMSDLLVRRGYDVDSSELSESLVRWVIATPFFCLIVGGVLWWWFNRNWVDDDVEDKLD